jgi:VanZ family protein
MTTREVISRFFAAIDLNELRTPRARSIMVFSAVVYVALVAALALAWYSRQWGASFQFFDDLAEWKQLDKLAHFVWAFHIAAVANRLLTWAKVTKPTAVLVATILSWIFISSIEVLDGFSADYGASVYDILANTLGCLAFLAQAILWDRIRIWPKFSFHPTAFAPLRPSMLGNGFLEEVLKDYNGQTFWYSFRASWLRLPPWLVIAVGIGADGMVYSRDAENVLHDFSAHRRYLLSVDLDLTGLQSGSRWVRTLLSVFTVIKLPAPAIEVSDQGIKFHPIYF